MAEATSGIVASGEKVSVGVGVCIDRVFDRERESIRTLVLTLKVERKAVAKQIPDDDELWAWVTSHVKGQSVVELDKIKIKTVHLTAEENFGLTEGGSSRRAQRLRQPRLSQRRLVGSYKMRRRRRRRLPSSRTLTQSVGDPNVEEMVCWLSEHGPEDNHEWALAEHCSFWANLVMKCILHLFPSVRYLKKQRKNLSIEKNLKTLWPPFPSFF